MTPGPSRNGEERLTAIVRASFHILDPFVPNFLYHFLSPHSIALRPALHLCLQSCEYFGIFPSSRPKTTSDRLVPTPTPPCCPIPLPYPR
jgi:hypothetical protein